MTITIREATKHDVSTIMEMLIGVAEYTNVPTRPNISLEDLIRDGGFDENDKTPPLYIALLAEDLEGSDPHGSKPVVGLAMCSFIYTLEGRTLFLNDLFVYPSHRSRGIGKLLFNAVLRYGKKTGHNCLDFYVVDWNPARGLYEKLGASNLTSSSNAHFHCVYKNAIGSIEV